MSKEEKVEPVLLVEFGRYHIYKKDVQFNTKIDDIWFFDWNQAPFSLLELLEDLKQEQKAYERYYNEFNEKLNDLRKELEDIKEKESTFAKYDLSQEDAQ